METKTVAVVDGRAAVHDFVVETLVGAGYLVRGFLSRATFLVEAPTVRPWIILLGASVLSGSPADFGKLIVEETAKWAKVVKISGAKPD